MQDAVVQRYAFPEPGTVVSVDGADAARALPGIAEVVIPARAGDVIPPAGDKRPSAAMVLATASTHAQGGATRQNSQQPASTHTLRYFTSGLLIVAGSFLNSCRITKLWSE